MARSLPDYLPLTECNADAAAAADYDSGDNGRRFRGFTRCCCNRVTPIRAVARAFEKRCAVRATVPSSRNRVQKDVHGVLVVAKKYISTPDFNYFDIVYTRKKEKNYR